MSKLDEIEARLAARSDGAHVAYESQFGCGGYLLKEAGDEEFFVWAGDDITALLRVARAAEPLTRNLTHRDRYLLEHGDDEDVCLVKDITVGEMRRLRAAQEALEAGE